MSGKMKWGPRFRNNGIADAGYRYSAGLDKGMRPPPQWYNLGPLKREFATAKAEVKRHPKKVATSQFSWSEKPASNDAARIEAEQRALERIEQAIRSIQLSLSELTHIPNPSSKFQNQVNQRALIDVLQKLCRCANPPIKLGDDPLETPQSQAKAAVRLCVNCGDLAPFPYKGEWYCEVCIDNADKAA